MEDTSAECERLVYDIVMSRTEEERFILCADMYETAREFAKIGMPEGLSYREQELFIFKRLHGATPQELVSASPQKKSDFAKIRD